MWRASDKCPTCFKLAGYAGHRASQDELRKHLACTCPTDEELDARDALIDLSVKQITGDRIEEKPLGDGWHRWAA